MMQEFIWHFMAGFGITVFILGIIYFCIKLSLLFDKVDELKAHSKMHFDTIVKVSSRVTTLEVKADDLKKMG